MWRDAVEAAFGVIALLAVWTFRAVLLLRERVARLEAVRNHEEGRHQG